MARKPTKARAWRIAVLRGKRGETLGTVEAPTAEAAIDVACDKFGIGPERRNRVVAQAIAESSK
jgi:hypothetical protein